MRGLLLAALLASAPYRALTDPGRYCAWTCDGYATQWAASCHDAACVAEARHWGGHCLARCPGVVHMPLTH